MLWFWQYKVEVNVWEDEITCKTKYFTGIAVGENIVKAIESLYAYYGEDLVDILTCKSITDGIFEFETVQEDGFFDYKIIYNPKNT